VSSPCHNHTMMPAPSALLSMPARHVSLLAKLPPNAGALFLSLLTVHWFARHPPITPSLPPAPLPAAVKRCHWMASKVAQTLLFPINNVLAVAKAALYRRSPCTTYSPAPTFELSISSYWGRLPSGAAVISCVHEDGPWPFVRRTCFGRGGDVLAAPTLDHRPPPLPFVLACLAATKREAQVAVVCNGGHGRSACLALCLLVRSSPNLRPRTTPSLRHSLLSRAGRAVRRGPGGSGGGGRGGLGGAAVGR
jgi:hypothetical protein